MNVKSLSLFAVSATCLLTVGRFEAKAVSITDHLLFDGSLTFLEGGNKISLFQGDVYDLNVAHPERSGEGLTEELSAASLFSRPVEGNLVGSRVSFGNYWLELGKVTSVSESQDENGESFFFNAEARLYSSETLMLVSKGIWGLSAPMIVDPSTGWNGTYDALPDGGASVLLLGVGVGLLMFIRKVQCCA